MKNFKKKIRRKLIKYDCVPYIRLFEDGSGQITLDDDSAPVEWNDWGEFYEFINKK